MKCDETRKFSLYVVLTLLLLRSADYMSTFTGPRCGPCTRLNRECDWHHRWNFSDATPTVQVRFQNVVKKEGNVVWDPKAAQERNRSPLPLSDHLPDFSVLTSDEDRERKAVVHKPGTFGVVVTPDSFRDLPEYATVGRSSSFRSRRGGSGRPGSAIGRSVALPVDTNTVILDKFEDVSPVKVASTSSSGGGRSEDFGEHMQRLSITSPPPPPPYIPSVIMAPINPTVSQDHHLLQHFRNYIVPRLVQPQADGIISQGSTRDVLEREALRFPPLHHAICAISALHLAYNGQSSLTEAMQHYHQALAVSSTTTTSNINNDLLSDGVFFRHYLLFVYDICIPVQSDDAGTDMSAEHLDHLRRIAVHRHHHFGGREPHAYTIWSICQLDVYACLMGSGSCEFVQTIVRNHMLPALEHQVPSYDTPGGGGGGAVLPPHESSIFPAILRLHEGIILRAARIAQIAQMLRGEYSAVVHNCSINNHNYIHNDNDSKQNPSSSSIPIPQEKYLRWIAIITQARTDLHEFWLRALPGYLASSSSSSTLNNNNFLPTRVQAVFESATLLYHAMMIYSWTSMFPRQRWYCCYYSAAVISSSLAGGGGGGGVARGITTTATKQSSSMKGRERKERRRGTPSSSVRTTAISPTAAPAATASTTTGIEAHITSILTLATRQIHHHHHHQERGAVERGTRGKTGSLNRQNLVFALFIAGVAAATTTTVTTTAANENEKKQKKQTWKHQTINLIRVLEGYGGIGQNTFRMRRLLERVFEKLEEEEDEEEEEEEGEKDVDWLAMAREMGLGAVGNCGL